MTVNKKDINFKNDSLKNRVQNIKEGLVKIIPSVCIERALLITESYMENEGAPVVLKRAKGLAKILNKMTIYIDKGQLIVGNQSSKARSAPVFPEYSVSWLSDELDSLQSRSGDRFMISEKDKKELREIFKYWNGKTLQERASVMQPPEVLEATKIGVIEWEGNVTAGEGHITVDYPKIVKVGLPGILTQVEKTLESLDLTEPGNLEKRLFYLASIITLKASINFIGRYSKLAEFLGKAENNYNRKQELKKISEICKNLTKYAPKNFYEALQLTWFVQLILQIESNGHSFSFGRIDQYLYPFYLEDKTKNMLSEESALELIECFYLKIFTINKIRPYSHTLIVSGYPTYQNICVGGQTIDGDDATNSLSFLFLDALANNRLSEPNFYIRVHDNMSEKFLMRAAEVVRMGFGMPAFVNDKVIIPSLLNRGVKIEDAFDYATMGCLEVSIPGKWGYRANGKIKFNLLKILELSLYGGQDPITNICLNPSETKLGNFKNFDEVMESWEKQLKYYMRLQIIADNTNSLATEQLTPDVFCSVLVSDCIGRGKLISDGGAIYDMQSGTQIGFANVANSLAAIKKIIFENKQLTQKELLESLQLNFNGLKSEKIRKILISDAPKYGNDDDYVDILGKEAYDIYCLNIDKYKNNRYGKGPIGGNWFASTVTISSNISAGASVGATPDGRFANKPTADGISPSHGTEKKGPTAVMRSANKLSTLYITGGNLLNNRIMPSSLEGEQGLQKLIALIKGHFSLYGFHIQFNTVDTKILKDAQRNPEKYPSLTVRVAGYSALFTALDKKVQDDIIERTKYTL